MQFAQKFLIALLLLISQKAFSMNDLQADVLFNAGNNEIYRNKAVTYINDNLNQLNRIEKEFPVSTVKLEDNDVVETLYEKKIDENELREYKNKLRQLINGLTIVVSKSNKENAQPIVTFNAKPLEEAIIKVAKPKIIEKAKQKIIDDAKENIINEAKPKIITDAQTDFVKKLPFYKRYPKFTFGSGMLSGGLLFGTLAHFGHNPVSFIFNTAKNKLFS